MKGYVMFKKLAQRLREYSSKTNTAPVTLPFKDEFIEPKNEYLKKLSKKAVELYEKQTDINNFSKLVLSDPENKNHNDLVNKLFNEGVADPFIDDKLEQLADNKRFLKDLGLM